MTHTDEGPGGRAPASRFRFGIPLFDQPWSFPKEASFGTPVAPATFLPLASLEPVIPETFLPVPGTVTP